MVEQYGDDFVFGTVDVGALPYRGALLDRLPAKPGAKTASLGFYLFVDGKPARYLSFDDKELRLATSVSLAAAFVPDVSVLEMNAFLVGKRILEVFDPVIRAAWNAPPSVDAKPVVSREPSLDEDLAFFGLTQDADAETAKRKYREFGKNNHPDKVSHVDPEIRAFAEKRLLAGNQAYQRICRARGW